MQAPVEAEEPEALVQTAQLPAIRGVVTAVSVAMAASAVLAVALQSSATWKHLLALR